jgi:hypothetical protein
MNCVIPIGAVLALLLLFTGCSSVSPPAPPPPAGYQDRLTRTDRDISTAFDAIDRAPNLPVLTNAVLAASGTVSAAGEQLASGGPTPASVSAQNDSLVAGLRQFGYELAYLSQQINLHVICTGSTAMNAITTAPSMAALRTASAALAAPSGGGPGYDWGGFLPAPRDPLDARMPNGRVVVDRRGPAAGTANGVLEVHDEEDNDAVLMLARGGATVVSVAVSAGQSTRLANIPDGVYDLYYTTGRDWDDVVRGFGRRCDFERFTSPTSFSSRAVSGGTAYTVQSITLRGTTAESTGGSPAPTTASPGAPGEASDTAEVPPDGLPR